MGNTYNEFQEKIKELEKEFERLNIECHASYIYDIILGKDGANLLQELNKRREVEKYVKNNINGRLPQEPNFKGKYFRKCIKKDGERIEFIGTSYYDLVEKLYYYLSNEIRDKSIEHLFFLAYERMESTTSMNEGTYKSYRDYYKRFINEEFAKMDISQITLDYLRKYSKDLVITLGLNECSFKKYKQVLNLIFRFAYEKDLIKKNLAEIISPKDYTYNYKVVNKKDSNQVFTEKQLDIIKKEIRKRILQNKKGAKTNGYAIMLAILNGMRVGELCALKWEDVNFEKREMHIHEQQLKEITPKGEKNIYYDVPWTKNEKNHERKGRVFPIYSELMDLLLEIQSMEIGSKYVIAHADKTPINKDAYSTYLRRLCKEKLGLEITNNHAFRKTLNSYVLMQNFPLSTRAKLLGHSPETNLRNYTYDPYSTGEENAALIDQFLETKRQKDEVHPIYPLFGAESQKKNPSNPSKIEA